MPHETFSNQLTVPESPDDGIRIPTALRYPRLSHTVSPGPHVEPRPDVALVDLGHDGVDKGEHGGRPDDGLVLAGVVEHDVDRDGGAAGLPVLEGLVRGDL